MLSWDFVLTHGFECYTFLPVTRSKLKSKKGERYHKGARNGTPGHYLPAALYPVPERRDLL